MTTAQSSRIREVLSNGEARALLVAQMVSEIGDQVARVAVAYFVLDRTDSLLYGALTLAIAYVPGIFGTAFLGTLADRIPRRALMLWCDLIRVFLVVLLAFVIASGLPLILVFALLLVGETVAAPFGIARSALWPDVMPQRDLFVAAHALSRAMFLAAQVIGFVAGGLLTQAIGVELALLLDGLTFVVSYVLIRARVSSRPVAAEAGTSASRMAGDVAQGWREVTQDPLRRWLILLGWFSAFALIAPEAVALGWRPDLNAAIGGMLLAAVPAGAAVGFLLIARLSLPRQTEMILPLAALSCLPLFAASINPPPVTAAALFFVAGVLQAWVLTIMAAATALTEAPLRGRVLGVASAGFSAATALSFAVIGALGDAIGPARAVSLAGLFGLLVVGIFWRASPGGALTDAVADTELLSLDQEAVGDLMETVVPVLPPDDATVDLEHAMAGFTLSERNSWNPATQSPESRSGDALGQDPAGDIAVTPETVAAAAPPAHVTEPIGTRVPHLDDAPVVGRLAPIPRTEVTDPVSAPLPEPDLRFAETASLVVDVPEPGIEPSAPPEVAVEPTAPPEVAVEPSEPPEVAVEPPAREPAMADPAIDILPGRAAPLPEWPSVDKDATQPVPRID